MRDQTCLQNINPRNINLGPHPISSICFHAKTGSLILGSNQVGHILRLYPRNYYLLIVHLRIEYDKFWQDITGLYKV